jgi:hypothetical protein
MDKHNDKNEVNINSCWLYLDDAADLNTRAASGDGSKK